MSVQKSERLEIRLEPSLLEAVDRVRGDVPRAVFVRRVLERAVERGPVPPSRSEYEAREVVRASVPSRAADDPKTSLPAVQRGRDLVGRDSAAMERQRKMNEAKGL